MRAPRLTVAPRRAARAILAVSALASPALASPALAAPIPADTTLDLRVMVGWPTRASGMPAADAAFYPPVTIEAGIGLRLFMVKDQMLVSVPHFTTQDVMAGGVATRQAAFIAGRGAYRCKKATLGSPGQPTAQAVNFCLSYAPEAGGFVFRFKYAGEVATNAQGSYDYALRVAVDGGGCTVRLLSGAMKIVVRQPAYDITQSATALARSASCTRLQGKQTY
ncbi:hypothetical protein [Ancylobacter sp. IITR112]|uniref:hypothetical protein n=1 Tax=Ancylobacter sp. IITR112 TaxID=3138073 RepID=UPI00352BBF26